MGQTMSSSESAEVMIARKNGRLSVVNAFLLSSASFLLPVWQLFYTLQLGLSLTQATLLMASSWVMNGIMNVPTGVWADKYGRLKLFRIGLMLNVAAYIPMFMTRNYWVLLAASLTSGFAVSMLNGTLEANAMDSYEQAGLTEKESARFGSSQMTAAYVGRVLSGMIGAWLYAKWSYAPLALDLVLLGLVFVQSLMIVEIRSEKPSTLPSWYFLKSSLKMVINHRTLLTFMFVSLIISIGCESFWAAFQQYLLLNKVPTVQFGVVYAVIAIVSAASAWAYRKIHEAISWRILSLITMLLITVGLLFSHWQLGLMPYVVAVIIGAGFGLINPTAYDVIQRTVRSQFRATVTSFRQMVYLFGFALSIVLVGRYVDVFGRGIMLDIITIQAVVFSIILALIAFSRED